MKPYYPNQKFKNKRSMIAIITVIVLAVALIVTGVTIALVEKNVPQPEISSIEFLSDKLGAYANFDEVNVKVVFSDNTSKIMRLSEFLPTGIDKSREGLQNVTLTYGNRAFEVQIEVVTTNVKIVYVTSGEGGSIEGDLTQSVPAGMSGTEVEAIPADGYSFAGWSDGVSSAVRRETDVSRDATIRAVFRKNSYIVTFMLADGTVREQTVQYGERAVPIAASDSALRKYGYRFDGWDTDEWQNVTKDLTVHPVLTPVRAPYDIYVSSLSGEPMGVKNITDTNVETDSLNGLNESEGMDGSSNRYLYKGYYQWGIPGAVAMSSADGRMFDYWEIYGSAVSGSASYYKLYPGSDAMLWLPGATEAVQFIAENGEKDGVEIQNLKFTLADGTELFEVRAVYAKKVSTVSFYTYGNLLEDRTVNLAFKSSLTDDQLRAPEERQGYDFIGWFTEQNVRILSNHEPFYVDTKLNAQYEAKTVKVTFKTSGGTVVKTAKYDQMLSNAEFPEIPAKEDFLANGWKIEGTDIAFSAETKLSEDVIVVPNYRRNTFDATFFKTGQGKIYYTEKDPYGTTDEERNGTEKELTVTRLSLKSGADYVFRFEANTAQGYSYKGYQAVIGSTTTGTGETLTVSNLKNEVRLSVLFERVNRTVAVQNGDENNRGTVTILDTDYRSEQFEVSISNGMPLELSITAPTDMKIEGIYLNGSIENLLPNGVYDSYTYHYEKDGSDVVTSDLSFVIVYAMKEFEVHGDMIVSGGSVIYYVFDGTSFQKTEMGADGVMKFPYGTKLKAEIVAEQGKYIEKLQIWGKSVDFYQYHYESFDSALFENGNPYFFTDRIRKGFEEKDPRVTGVSLYLNAPNRTTDIAAQFGTLRYRVGVTSVGQGTATLSETTVEEGGSVNLIMQTDASYVIEGYTRVNRGETDKAEIVTVGENNSSLRETIAGITTDVQIEVRFQKRSYDVLFYTMSETGLSYRVVADDVNYTVDSDSSASFTMLYGDSKTYRIAAREGFEIAELLLVDGHEQPVKTVTLPVNTDVYDLVVNKISASCGVKVTLRKKTYEVKLATNALSSKIGKITLSDGTASSEYDAVSGGAFAFGYGSEVKISAKANTKFFIKSFTVDGKTLSLGENALSAEITVTVDGGKKIEIIFAYGGTGTGIIVDETIQEGNHSAHGYVAFDQPTDSTAVVMFRAFPEEGYVLKALYSNGVLLKNDGYGEYPSAYDPKGIQYITAVFEKKEMTLTLLAENGKLSSEKDYVLYGETANVWFVADTGYELASVRKNQKYLSEDELVAVRRTGKLELSAEDTKDPLGAVTVTAVFTPIAYQLSGKFDPNATGGGSVQLEEGLTVTENKNFDVFYGDRMTFRFVADEGSYIAGITLNGVTVELSQMTDAVQKTSNGKYASGKFDVVVTGDTELNVRFDRDVFKVTVAESAGGTAALSPVSVMGNDEYSSDESITVSLTSVSGYHIAALYINGVAQDLNFQSTEEPNLNTSVLYLIPKELLVRNLVIRAEFERNSYSVRVTAENESLNFKTADNTVERFMEKVSLEYGGADLKGREEADRANSRYTVTYQGIEHAGAPRVTLKPRVSSGYYLKNVSLSYRTSEGTTATVNYTAQFNEENDYSMALPSLYWDITDFNVVVARKTVSVKIPSSFLYDAKKTAIRIEPSFYVGSEIAVPSSAKIDDVYVYEFGVRLDLAFSVTEGFTPTKFMIKTTNSERNFLGDVVFRNGKGTYSATLADNTEFSFEASVTMVTLTLSKVGAGSGTFNFVVAGSPKSEPTVTVEYGTPVGIVVVAEKANGSYLRAVRIDDVSQNLGQPSEDGYYYEASLTGSASRDAKYEVDLAILEYTFRTELSEGVQGVAYNNDTVNVFPWGTERVSVRIELRQGYELKGITLNGKELGAENYVVDGSLVTFQIFNVSSDQNIVPNVGKKTFTASNNDSSLADNKTEILRLKDDGNYEIVENNVKNNIAYGDRLFFRFRPAKNYYVDSYNVSMKTLGGVWEQRNGAVTYPDEKNSDIFLVDAGLVTGDVNVEILYRQKVYTLEYRDDAGGLGVGEVRIGQSQILGGDGVAVTIQTKNLPSADGKSTVYYGVQSVRINGYDYFAEKVPFDGWGELSDRSYDSVTMTYFFRYRLVASDALMLGTDERIGSGTDFTLKLEIVIEKNLYYLEEVVVRNKEKSGDSESVLQVKNGTFGTTEFTGKFSDSIFDGSSDLLELDMSAAYSPVFVGVRTDDSNAETAIQSFAENVGSQKILITATASVADMSNPFKKTIRLVIEIDRNRYDTGFSVLTNEKDGQQVSIGENQRGVRAKIDDKEATDKALEKISHGSVVSITANEEEDYDFAGFETYDEQTGIWVKAENVVADGVTIVSVEGRELTVAVVREFRYRAVYYKKVKVDIVLAPWHKYLSGTYVSGNGSELNYVNYASLIVTVGGEEKRYEVEQSKNDNGIFRYVFRYGDLALLEARDEKSGTNASKKITFYLQNKGSEHVMQSVDAVSAGQMRFQATRDYVYNENVADNEAMYVAFDNQIKLNVATETLGGADSKDGASFVYEKKASGANTSYNAINLTNGKTANVSMFDRIRITVTVQDGYRFESFSRYQAQRDSVNLTFLNNLESFARFNALGLNDWELVTAGGADSTLISDSRFEVKKFGEKIVIEFTVTNNSIYKFDLVKVYDLNGFVSAPKFVGDGLNETPVEIEAEGNKSYFACNASGVAGKVDYGATVTLKTVNDNGNELFAADKWQFVSWYANGVAIKSSGVRNFNYYDEYADERIVLNEQYGFVGNAKTDTKFEFYAEFLPIYEIQSREYYEIDGVQFRPSSSFEMAGLYYDNEGAQVQIPQNPYSAAVNLGDGSVVAKKYLPFDARKGGADGDGKPNSAKYANALSLNVVNAVSYSIVSWNIYYGDYNADNPAAGLTFAGNTQNVTFTMTKEIYDALTKDGGNAYRPVTIVPVFSKKNDFNIRKSVFYSTFGVPSQSGRSDNNPGIVYGNDYIDTEALSSGILSVNYGETVTFDANPKASYRFIGWFDPSQPQDSTVPQYGTEKRLTVEAKKTSNEDYTFYYEARYVRTVTLNLTSLNISGSNMTGSSANILKGDSAEGGWLYQGIDISRQGTSQTKTFDSENNGNNATLVADVGSYALFRLAGDKNNRGFDPVYDIFINCVATSGSADYTATKQSDGSWKVVVFLNSSKTIAAQYETYGTVTLEGLLDQSEVTLGADMSKNIYEYAAFINERAGRTDGVTSADLMNCAFDGSEVVTASYDSVTKRISVKLHQSNQKGSISVRGVKMADYRSDVLTFRFQGLDSLEDDWANQLGLNFHGNNVTFKTATTNLTNMPFASGAGTESNPYFVSGYEQFLNIGKIFTQNGGSLSGVYLKQTADITLSGDWNPMCAGENGFNGDLNGDNKTIFIPQTLQSVSNPATGGIFAKTGIGTVRNYKFRMSGTEVRMAQQQSDAGIVAGIANGTNFENLVFDDFNVIAYGKTFGLVAGNATESSATIVLVKNLNLEYQRENKGSVFGMATDTVLDGITFTREATSDSVFRTVTTGSSVGGIVGTLSGPKSELKNSYLYGGNIRATGAVGGAIGMMTDGAKITNVGVILKTLSGTVPQMLQVSAENTVTVGSTSITPNPSTESDAAGYAAGGLVGVMSKSFAEGLYLASEVTTLMQVSSPYVLYRNYPTVSVVGSVAGGLVGVNGNGSSVKESYIEEGATAEILMPSRSDVNSASSTRNSGSDGIFGGIVASNFGTVYHCGVNGKTYNGKTGFDLDQVGGGTGTSEYTGYKTGDGVTNPFDSQNGTEKGMQLNASVEFLYAACSAVSGKLQKSLKNNFYYGANYMRAHGSTNDYQGDQFAARGTSTTIMGGIAGYNARTGFVNSSYVAGKVVHFRRLITDSNGTLYSILGGVVGYNMNYVYNSGVLNTAVYNFVKPVTDNLAVNSTVTAGGVIGYSQANYLRGLFSYKTAVRAVNDPYSERGAKKGGGAAGSTFSALAAALVSNATTSGTQDGMFSYGDGNKVSATQDTIDSGTGDFKRVSSLGGINVAYYRSNDFGGNDKGVFVSGSFDTMLGTSLVDGVATLSGNMYFASGNNVWLLNADELVSTGKTLNYLGKKNDIALRLAS